jgi:hypothetical protein
MQLYIKEEGKQRNAKCGCDYNIKGINIHSAESTYGWVGWSKEIGTGAGTLIIHAEEEVEGCVYAVVGGRIGNYRLLIFYDIWSILRWIVAMTSAPNVIVGILCGWLHCTEMKPNK